MATNLDQALTDLGSIQDDLNELCGNPNLTAGVSPLVARAVGSIESATDFIELAIAVDNAAHPEDQ